MSQIQRVLFAKHGGGSVVKAATGTCSLVFCEDGRTPTFYIKVTLTTPTNSLITYHESGSFTYSLCVSFEPPYKVVTFM